MSTKAFKVSLDPDSGHDLFCHITKYIPWLNETVRTTDINNPPVWEDTVFYESHMTCEEVKKSLVDHDGYNPDIEVTCEEEDEGPGEDEEDEDLDFATIVEAGDYPPYQEKPPYQTHWAETRNMIDDLMH
jgi:hypothetical protein